MNESRADFAISCFKEQIYVFGGMSFDEDKGSPNIQSLNSVEVYSIAEDKWT